MTVVRDRAIAILPYGQRLGPHLVQMPVDQLNWPLGRPARLAGGVVGDFRSDDHLIVYPRTDTHFRLQRGTAAAVSLIMAEPSVIHAKHYALLRLTWRRFFRVLTFNQPALDSLPNARLLPFGTTWVPDWRDLAPEKTLNCSLIASAKRDSEGHKLRHAVVDWVRETGQDVAVLGRGYRPFESKADGLVPYRYSVVIENVRERNYFSEKLLDSVFCETVPIYWGCPNIADFVDPSAMILCETAEQVRAAVLQANPEDYAARLPALRALKEQLAPFADHELRAAQIILEETGRSEP
ncbi:hypothetical protein [Ruegeria marina]|uniref:Glycosyltransferase family 10 (Fucosyltransferase) C-term n=1 Tax=Ruegeria marina TaxID=639004 RepID=A0A1G6RR51_9RHOB|nr:hypothetical protein [Ruegeria marina]SDD06455.1 hypothetical protein SAMN04488239_10532 [Ruegeria marina]